MEIRRAEFAGECRGRAVKVLNPHLVDIPRPARVIWLDRHPDERLRSVDKFLRATIGVGLSRDERRAMRAADERDRAAAFRRITRPGDGSRLIAMTFELLTQQPLIAAYGMACFVREAFPAFDAAAAAAAVRPRPIECLPDMRLELGLIEQAQ